MQHLRDARASWPSFDELLANARRKTPEQREAERQELLREEFETYRRGVTQRAIDRCQALSEIGPRFAQRTFETFEATPGTQDALDAARAIADAAKSSDPYTPGGYFFSSEPGLGKTHLAGAIVNDCVSCGVPAVFTTGVGLLMRIRDSYNRRGEVKEGELDIIQRLTDVRVLVIDDLGTERFTADSGRLLYALVNGRYERNLGVIATSNLSIASLALQWAQSGVEEHVGKKTIDRLREMCTYKVELAGKSRRG